jgi:hypothetical protein
MKYLGRVICNNRDMRLIEKLPFIEYSSQLNLTEDIPSMVIGWEFVKTLFPDRELSILDHELTRIDSWCFSPVEKRVGYEKCINNFYNNIFQNIADNSSYHFVNIFDLDLNSPQWLEDIIPENGNAFIEYDSFLYIQHNSNIIGVNLEDVNYVDISNNSVKKILYNKKNKVFYDINVIPDNIKMILLNYKPLFPLILPYFDKQEENKELINHNYF